MLKFKKIDLFVQVFGIILLIAVALIFRGENWLYAYFVIGTIQVLSMLIHYVKSWFTSKGSNRYKYQLIILIITIITPLAFVVNSPFFVLYALLYTAPLLAIYYCYVCFKEIKILEAKAFIHLK
jgi:hypothetical protein